MKIPITFTHRGWRRLVLFSFISLGSAGFAQTHAQSTWTFEPSELTGGGLATEIAVSPWVSGEAAAGGDSWGLYHTLNAGDRWLPAMKSTPGNPMTGENGTYYYSGLAYSKNPATKHVVYGLVGRCGGKPTEGGFAVITGDTLTRWVPGNPTSAPTGTESSCNHKDHPRPTGNRIVVDWEQGSAGRPGKEYIYAAGGNGTGVWRSTGGGAPGSWTKLALDSKSTSPVITGMALVPGNGDKLVVTTQTSTIYVLSGIRSAPPGGAQVQTVDLKGLRFEEVATVGQRLYAAARTHGVYTSSDGVHWTPTQGSSISGSDIVTVGGSADGSLLFAGCLQPQGSQAAKAAPCLFRSKQGGDWEAVALKPDFREWGSNQKWWHSRSSPGAMIDGNRYITSQIAVDTDGHTVYVAGRAGVWKSENSGDDWRPAVVGLQGTMHTAIAWDDKAQAVETNDEDFGCEKSPPGDHFSVADSITDTPVDQCPALHVPGTPPKGCVSDSAGKFTVCPPQDNGTPARFLVNGKPQPTPDWFKAQVIKPTGVLYKDGWLYIVQYGGGIVLGHPQPPQLSAR